MEYLPHIIIGFLGLLSTTLGIILTHQLQRKKELEIKLYDNRRVLYLEVLKPFIESFKNIKLKKQQQINPQMIAKMIETNIHLCLFASDSVVKASNKFRQKAIKDQKEGKQDPQRIIRDFADLILEIRKDLGNSKTKLSQEDILQGFISDIIE